MEDTRQELSIKRDGYSFTELGGLFDSSSDLIFFNQEKNEQEEEFPGEFSFRNSPYNKLKLREEKLKDDFDYNIIKIFSEQKDSNIEVEDKNEKKATLLTQKRGRKKKDETLNTKKQHTKYDRDNILGKIQVHYISFLVNYINLTIKKNFSIYHPIFLDLNYNFKRNTSKKFMKELKEKTVGEILKTPPTVKNNKNIKDLSNVNKMVFDSVYKKNTELGKLLDKNYLDLFHEIYFVNKIDDEKENKNVKSIEIFKDLLLREKEKNPSDIVYISKIVKVAEKEFIKSGKPIFTTIIKKSFN